MRCGAAVVVVVVVPVLLAALVPEHVLPTRVRIATQLLGWQGFFKVTAENVALRMGHRRNTKSRQAWHELLDTMRDFDLDYLSPERGIADDDDIAEVWPATADSRPGCAQAPSPPALHPMPTPKGHRFGLQLLSIATSLYASVHPSNPEFRRMVDPDHKYMGDNPDTQYFYSHIDPDLDYKISGRPSGELYMSITIYEQNESGAFPSGTVAHLDYDSFELNGDGSFEVILARTRPAGAKNFVQTNALGRSVVTRHYFANERPAGADPDVHVDIRIETLEAQPLPAPPTDAEMAERLHWVKTFFVNNLVPKRSVEDIPKWFGLKLNTMGRPQKLAHDGFGARDMAYGAGPFSLQPDEALVVTHTLPRCRFVNILLYNRHLQTFDYLRRPVSINMRQMKNVSASGAYTVVVAHRNPGPAWNWLDTEGRQGGTVFWRILLPEDDAFSQPEARVVKFSALASP